MIFIKTNLIFGAISSAVKLVLKAIYKVVAFFNLRLTLAVLLVGVLLFFTGVFTKTPVMLYVFIVAVSLTLVYSVFANYKGIKKAFEKGDKKEKQQEKEIEEKTDKQVGENQTVQPVRQKSVEKEKIKYYRVKQNPNYIMAEYSDKYVLYYDNGKTVKYVRTDYK